MSEGAARATGAKIVWSDWQFPIGLYQDAAA